MANKKLTEAERLEQRRKHDREYMRKWRSENKERAKKYAREYVRKYRTRQRWLEYVRSRREHSNQLQRKYRNADIEKSRLRTRESVRKHREKDREAYNAYMRAYRKSNPERMQILDRRGYDRKKKDIEKFRETSRLLAVRRRAVLHNVEATLTFSEWIEILDSHNRKCFYCGKTLEEKGDCTMDHKTPITRGGPHSKENVVPACRRCNARKHTKTTEEFVRHCERATAYRSLERRLG